MVKLAFEFLVLTAVRSACGAEPAALQNLRGWGGIGQASIQWDKPPLDPKLRSSIIEGLSVFLSVFDLPAVARTFCPPAPATAVPEAPADAPVGDSAPVTRPLPPLDEVIDAGKVLCLNMPAGTNPALSRAVGVLLKQAWLRER